MKNLSQIVSAVALILCSGTLPLGRARGQDAATADEAAAVLDLSKMVRPNQVGPTMSESVAALSYQAEGDVAGTAKKIQQQLEKEKWIALDGAAITEQYASVTLQKKGFSLSLTVTPGSEPGKVLVALTNHGNVDLKKLKLPQGLTQVYATPAMVIYNSNTSAAQTNQVLLKALKDAGWEPFGETTVSFFVKKHAVRLQVMVSEPPQQPAKSTVQISSEQMSVDLPVPPDVKDLQYSESPTQLSFRGTKELAHWVAYFKETLGKLGWNATTENAVKSGFTEHLFFQNANKQMIELEFRPGEKDTSIRLRYSDAAQVKREREKADAAIAKAKLAREQAMKKKDTAGNNVVVPGPTGTQPVSKTTQSVELSAKPGSAQTILANWFKLLKDAGWQVKATIETKEAGEYEVRRGDDQINVSVLDPGFIPATITISVSGSKHLDLKDAP